MPISRSALRGYILEEVLAYLIRNAGYRLLVDRSQDLDELDHRGNGLVVKGRGGVHQVDVLGELEWIPAFTFPIRLFLEAKFRSKKTGIGEVRNAVGVVEDLNQNNFPQMGSGVLKAKYHYAYALFSTSGFSSSATKMALAHQISLVDLSGPDFSRLLSSIETAAGRVLTLERHLPREDDETDENPEIDNEGESIREALVRDVRATLRRLFRTQPTGVAMAGEENRALRPALANVVSIAEEYEELFVAMANGPHMMLLKADNLAEFLQSIRSNPSQRVVIHWSRNVNEGKTWTIEPSEQENGRRFRLTFNLPERIAEWVFGNPAASRARALTAKQELFSNIMIYRRVDGRDTLVRLSFDPRSTQEFIRRAKRGLLR